jgi:hypothetical protein
MEEQQPWKGVQLLQQDSKRSRLEIGTDPTSTSIVSEIPSSDMEVPVLASDLALSQGLFPTTCISRREKLEYAIDVAIHCGAALKKVWTCLTGMDNPLKFMECVKDFKNHRGCQDAMKKDCGELEPKCCRCQTKEPIPSNQKHGCLLEIFKGDSCGAACKLLDVSSGRYRREWFGSGKKNYRFYGNCSEAEHKGGDKFTQHELCPAP